MKNKYIIISVVVVAALSMGAFVGQNTDSEKNHVQVERTPHADGEEKEHDTHDHKEHGNNKSAKPDEHAEHDEHAEEGGEGGHGEEIVRLSDAELREFGVTLATAQAGILNQYVELPGEIVLNADRLAHVVPRVAGIVREVRATVGDQVKKGQLLAVLESRELADAKASYLAAVERETLAQANFKREERLWGKKVTSEQEYLNACQALAEARIVKNSTEQKLHALGFTDDVLKELPEHPDATYTRFEIRAPLGGKIIEKHMTLGEYIGAEADVFIIADLSTVWVNITVYQRDLARVKSGQEVEIRFGHGIPNARGRIEFVSPTVDEGTRTAFARVVLENPDHVWRPGLFVTAIIGTGHDTADVVVPRSAVIELNGKQVVFVETDKGLLPREVKTGRKTKDRVEIVSGMRPGERCAYGNVLALKAELNRGTLEHAGHAH